MGLTPMLRAPAPLPSADFSRLRRRAIFEAGKLDPQVGDHETLAAYPLLLEPGVWAGLAADAEGLAREALAAEAELLTRPELQRRMGIPSVVRRLWREAHRRGPAAAGPRVMRADFHPTPTGWQVSELNTDVPGGFLEAYRIARLMAEYHPGHEPCGDPAGALARALVRGLEPGSTVALVHATAYVDDHQVMRCLGDALSSAGLVPRLASPTNLCWRDGRGFLAATPRGTPLGAILRFFPAEWLPGAPRACGWEHFFRGACTPLSNPTSALLLQSKRFALAANRLRTPRPTWERLVPEAREPRQVPRRADPDWVFKPAFGRVGECVGIRGVTPPAVQRRIERAARWSLRRWVAQRRFDSLPLPGCEAPTHACVGVFTVDGRAVGAYGRVAPRPLIDGAAQDAAVLVPRGEGTS